ncbi:MAG TPA: CRISPR-associated protein Csm3 [Cyanobacteria bacterium UBA11162]|nr:CRISPR-associated protein Csm3 [Cyanobacteria bacterium UBA11162]
MIHLQQLLSNSVESISLTAVIDTALCVGAGGSSGSLADKPIVRTAERKLLIPASQLKGRLRHECEKLARGLGWYICQSPNPQTMCPQRAGFPEEEERHFHRNDDYRVPEDERYHCLICQIFGNPTLPSRIIFDDLICEEDPENLPEVLRPGVTINRRRGTAEEKKLYFLETSPANAKLQFEGKIHLQPNCPDYTKVLLLAGLHHIKALGGSKSAGLGWLHWEFKGLSVAEIDWQLLLPKGEK